MLRTRLLLFATLGLGLVSSPTHAQAPRPSPDDPADRAHRATLRRLDLDDELFPEPVELATYPNGLRVLLVPWESPGIVSFYSLVDVGSRDEVEPGHSGFAHLFEHMMFRGTEQTPAEEYEATIQEMGADNNAYTTSDLTLYQVTLPSSELARVIALEADRFQRLSYDEAAFRTETGAVQGEYGKNISGPLYPMWEALREMAFTEHTYSHTTMGYLRDICAMPEMLDYSRDFFRRFYTPDATTLLVVGDFERDAALREIEAQYGGWEGSRARTAPTTEPAPEAGASRHLLWDGATPRQLLIGYRTPAFSGAPPSPTEPPRSRSGRRARGDRRGSDRQGSGRRSGAPAPLIDAELTRERAIQDSAALEIVHGLIFSDAAPLTQELVVRDRTLLELESWSGEFARDPALFVVAATLAEGQTDFDAVVARVQRALDEVAAGEVSHERLEAVRSHLRYALIADLQTPHDVAQLLAHTTSAGRSPESLREYLHALAHVTTEDLARVAASYLTPTRRFVVSVAERGEGDPPAPASTGSLCPAASTSPTAGDAQ